MRGPGPRWAAKKKKYNLNLFMFSSTSQVVTAVRLQHKRQSVNCVYGIADCKNQGQHAIHCADSKQFCVKADGYIVCARPAEHLCGAGNCGKI